MHYISYITGRESMSTKEGVVLSTFVVYKQKKQG